MSSGLVFHFIGILRLDTWILLLALMSPSVPDKTFVTDNTVSDLKSSEIEYGGSHTLTVTSCAIQRFL